MNTDWHYIKRAAMTVGADMMSNPLRQTKLSTFELLMREAIQNSVDERSNVSEPTRFTVRRQKFTGATKLALIEAFKLRSVAKRVHSYKPETEMGWLKIEETCLASLDDPDTPIPVLFLSDHNTNGLGGDWRRREGQDSRFHNLVLSVYASNKTDTTVQTLGSYGIGKMVYAIASKIRTIAYYSTFVPTQSTDGHSARFMASAFLPEHEYHGDQYTGHAFLGAESHDEQYPTKPLYDDEAHQIVQQLSLTPRSGEDTGLTVMLLDCDITPQECRSACETYWWPKIIDEDLILEFSDEDQIIAPPRPTEREDISPFIHCYNNHIYEVSPPGEHSKPLNLQKYGNVGHLNLVALQNTTSQNKARSNSVALIRNGLVIQYNPEYAREGEADVLGTFVASDQSAQHAYKLSEPEAHDQWNQYSDRLRTSIEGDGPALVRLTHERIKTTFRDFQVRLKEQVPRPSTDGLSFIDDLLGPMFRKRREGLPIDPSPSRRAFGIHKQGWRESEGKQIFDKIRFSINLTSEVDVSSIKCIVKISLKVLEAVEGVQGDTVQCEVADQYGQTIYIHDDTFEIELFKDNPSEFTAIALVHDSWRTRWQISVSRVDS